MIAFSPVRQNPEVLRLFLTHMARQPVDLWVYDDNVDEESSRILQQSGARILPPLPALPKSGYRRAEDTHKWDVSTYHRVARIKNYGIDQFMETDASHLFLIDSDVLIQPGLIDHLADADEPIIASVYWTSWHPRRGQGPNMWGSNPRPLRTPGHHEVVGTGACTLIQRDVLSKVRFAPEPHNQQEGEDRWFCWHAREYGYRLMMCSHLNPFHVYRDSEIRRAEKWSNRALNSETKLRIHNGGRTVR